MGKNTKAHLKMPVFKHHFNHKNTFILKGCKQLYYQGIVNVDFEPVKTPSIKSQNFWTISQCNTVRGKQKSVINRKIIESQTFELFSIIPKFNNDHKYYTPCFINPYEEITDQSEVELTFHHKVAESIQEITFKNILIPKPRSKNKYCAVCKDNYDDYLEHIKSNSHKHSIKNATFNPDILSLAKIFQAKNMLSNMVIATRGKRKAALDAEQKLKLQTQEDGTSTIQNSNEQSNKSRHSIGICKAAKYCTQSVFKEHESARSNKDCISLND